MNCKMPLLCWMAAGVTLGAILFAAVCATPAQAGSCGTVHFPNTYAYSANYKQAYHDDYDVKKRVVILEYQLIPAFPIGYAAPAAPAPAVAPVVAAPTPCEETAKRLEAKIAALEARLAAGVSPAPAAGAPANALPATAPKTPVLSGKCARCHDEAASAAKAKSVTLFKDRSLVPLDDKATGAILRALSAGTMPPDGKLSPEDFTACMQELVNLNTK